MDLFINELSLHGQYNSDSDFEKAVRQFLAMIIFANEQSRHNDIFKSDLLINREALANTHFSASFEKLRNKDIKDKFRRVVFNKANPKNWKEGQIHNAEEFFICPVCPENDGLVSGTTLAEVSERQLRDNKNKHILLNFCASFFLKNALVSVIKNDVDTVHLICFEEAAVFERWCTQLGSPPKDWFLHDKNKFQRVTGRHAIQGATRYIEVATRYTWYIDNFHQDHFEIFDSTGKHIGVAELDGNLRPNSKVEGREISL